MRCVISFSIFFFLVFVFACASSSLVFAQETKGTGNEPPITDIDQVPDILNALVKWLYGAFWIVDVGFIIWAAFTLLQGGTNPEKLKTATKMLLYALVAAAIVLLANGIQAIVGNILQGSL